MTNWTPKRRDDNLCACGCGQPIPAPRPGCIREIRVSLLRDPFATTACAKRFYGVELTMGPEKVTNKGTRNLYHGRERASA